jgi:glycine dehydrogenase subunit 1
MYNHFIPAHVDQLVLRSEIYTAYTPYQAEIAQGTLQTIFEFQTMISMLTGLEVANASLYDGANAAAEAIMMALRINKRKAKVVVSEVVHVHYQEVCDAYLSHLDLEIVSVPVAEDGRTDIEALKGAVDDNTACVLIQSPNFLGTIEDVSAIADIAHEAGALLAVTMTEALSMALVKSPGELGADIVCGEGQSFGIPMSYGGPSLGFFATREKFLRQIPGRLVGQTEDVNGKPGFVLALATREQHIRRGKATSNICTNQGLFMTMATIYLETMGKVGLRELAILNLQKAAYLKEKLRNLAGVELPYSSPTFNEFVIRTTKPAGDVLKSLEKHNILGGMDLGRIKASWQKDLLVCATELNTRDQIDAFAAAMEEVL